MTIDASAFLSAQTVARQIGQAAEARQSYAMIRIGDGKALTMAQGAVRSLAFVAGHSFLREAGVLIPDLTARGRVVDAVRHADLVGVALRRDLPNFGPLTEEAFNYFGLRPGNLCDCCINYALQGEGLLVPSLGANGSF